MCTCVSKCKKNTLFKVIIIMMKKNNEVFVHREFAFYLEKENKK
jgi:hypothetical protein